MALLPRNRLQLGTGTPRPWEPGKNYSLSQFFPPPVFSVRSEKLRLQLLAARNFFPPRANPARQLPVAAPPSRPRIIKTLKSPKSTAGISLPRPRGPKPLPIGIVAGRKLCPLSILTVLIAPPDAPQRFVINSSHQNVRQAILVRRKFKFHNRRSFFQFQRMKVERAFAIPVGRKNFESAAK